MGAAYLGMSEGIGGWAEGSVAAGGEGVEAVGGGVGVGEGHAFEFMAGAPGVGEEDLDGLGLWELMRRPAAAETFVKRVACFECADQASLRRAV